MSKLRTSQKLSKTEQVFINCLSFFKNIEWEMEPETVKVIDDYSGTLGFVRGTTYTPDFKVILGKRELYIETKGFNRSRDNLIQKLVDRFYKRKGKEYYVITIAGTKKNNNKNFYIYKHKNIASRGATTLTFWEYVFGMDKETSNKLYDKAHRMTLKNG